MRRVGGGRRWWCRGPGGPAAPVQADDGGIVTQVTTGGVDDVLAHPPHDLPRMLVDGAGKEGPEIELFRGAFEQAVGDQGEAIPGLERHPLDLERPPGLKAERQVNLEVELGDHVVADPKRRRVPGVDHGDLPGTEVDPGVGR